MKVSIYNAISIDGFIAKQDDNTDWVSEADWKIFSQKIKESKVIVMGRRTYESFEGELPQEAELNVVMTHNAELLSKKDDPQVWFSDLTPEQIIQELSKKYDSILVIGGGKTNAAFMKAGLVDEVTVDIHPIILGKGVPLFGGETLDKKLTLEETVQGEAGLVLATYGVGS